MNEKQLTTKAAVPGLNPRSNKWGAWCRLTPAWTGNTKNVKRYDQDFEIKLHNIIQELINNTIKHSRASNASIHIEDVDDKIKIYIKDNGKGFDKQLIKNKNGLGINQINARIHMMKGEFNIESENNSGTSITIELPVFRRETLSFS